MNPKYTKVEPSMLRTQDLQQVVDQINVKFALLEGTIEYLKGELETLKKTQVSQVTQGKPNANQKSPRRVQVGKQGESLQDP